MSDLVNLTTKISIGVQLATGLLGLYGLTLPLAPEDNALNEVLTLEMVVQVIEFLFYIGFAFILNLGTLTESRYFDWFLSTPIMLFTTALYFYYETQKERMREGFVTMEGFARENQWTIVAFVALNALMLLCGFMAELGLIPRWFAFVTGTAFLCGSFWIIYEKYAKYSEKTKQMFYALFAVWAAYGIAFLCDPVTKNIAYSCLDIIAKNFFGVYLFMKIREKTKALPVKTEADAAVKAKAVTAPLTRAAD
jgi:bacteriorhodopsin